MGTGAVSDRDAITAVLDRFEAAQAEVAARSFDALTAPEVLTVRDRLETIDRRQTAVDHRLTHHLTAQASPIESGAKSWTDMLSHRLRTSRGAPRRRLDEANDLGPRTAMTGQPLQPLLPNVAAAQAAGTVGAEHVRIIRRFFADLPGYLTIFDKHTGRALHLGRTRRIASTDQRIVLPARDRGCTRPGCTVAGAHCQVHHANDDWADGGQTNIDDLTLACPADNRSVKPDGWRTQKRKDRRTEWIPPPHLDTGQSRVNNYHHPENYLLPDEHDEP